MMKEWIVSPVLMMIVAAGCVNSGDPAGQNRRTSDRAGTLITVPLCTVVENPAAYDGKRVTINGCVTTDGREYVVLSNLEKPCSRGGLVPVETLALRREQRFDAQPGQKVCGTFTGTFRASNGLFDRVLEVEETFGLTRSALTQ
jgi:hypothetical protein